MFKRIQISRSMCRTVRQRGSALIVALVFLLVMTLIGTTAMQGTTQQERMAGNYLDRMMAFQGAEGALTVAKSVLSPPSPNQLNPAPGQQPVTWWENDANSTPITGYDSTDAMNPLSSPPRYVVEKLSGMGRSQSGGVDIVGRSSEGTFMCRYTAWSTGGSSDALMILEEIRDCT